MQFYVVYYRKYEGVKDCDFQHFFLTQSQYVANTAVKRIKN